MPARRKPSNETINLKSSKKNKTNSVDNAGGFVGHVGDAGTTDKVVEGVGESVTEATETQTASTVSSKDDGHEPLPLTDIDNVVKPGNTTFTDYKSQGSTTVKIFDIKQSESSSECKLAGVNYSTHFATSMTALDGFPSFDDPRLPSVDALIGFREEGFDNVYGELAPLRYVAGYIQYGKSSTGSKYYGVPLNRVKENNSEKDMQFFLKAVQFQSYNSKAINLARANAYADGLSWEGLPTDRSTQVTKFLMMNHKPVICVSPIIVAGSSLHSTREMVSGGQTYAIKDVAGQFIKHEWERSLGFLGTVMDTDVLHVNGIPSDNPTISIGTRVTKASLAASKSFAKGPPTNRKSSAFSQIAADNYDTPSTSTLAHKFQPYNPNKHFLWPSEDVPVYDFSSHSFNFASDFDISNMDNKFQRLGDEPIDNSPCIVAYYPSVMMREGNAVVSLNIKWIGVIVP